jgi:hyaluronate lyase
MQMDNKYIAAGMDFVSEYCDVDEGQYDEVRGWSRAVHKNDLVAKKAWFCFDDEAVLLGAGITSTMNSPVNTIAAHRRIVKDDEFTQTIGTKDGVLSVPKAEYEERFENPRYFNWTGHAGYVFLDKTDLLVNRYNYTTDIEQPYLELRVEHGENPTGATYAFAVLPYATDEKLDEYSKNPDVVIVSNTEKIQAVRDTTLGITGYVFYGAGECENISVDRGAILSVEDSGEQLAVTVCDPTHLEKELTVKLCGSYKLVSATAKTAAVEIDGGYEIKINCEGAMGAPFKAVFAK